MRSTLAKLTVAATLPMMLGGCSSILSELGLRRPATDFKVTPSMAATGEGQATEAGRAQLDAGQLGLAIESFRNAMTQGEPAGPAANGLGVAYARLGRFDLAQRFFEQAMAADPANEKYQANLALLYRSPTFAMRRDGDVAATALASADRADAATPAPPPPATAAAPVPGRLERVAKGEYRVQTASSAQVPATGVAAAEAVRVRTSAVNPGGVRARAQVAGFKPVTRLSLTPRDEPKAAARMERVSRWEVRVVAPAADTGAAGGRKSVRQVAARGNTPVDPKAVIRFAWPEAREAAKTEAK